jgi:polysaccharide biosynthesis/export protein
MMNAGFAWHSSAPTSISRIFPWALATLLAAIPATPQSSPRQGGSYRIGAGDELHVVVWRNEELTMTVPVRPDGFISLPLVNDVEVAGLTAMQVRDALEVRYQEFVSSPLVSVIVTRVGSFKVSVIGNVRSPGRFDLEGQPTILDALATAGGPDEYARKDEIYVLRGRPNAFQRFPFKYSLALKSDGPDVNFALEPGDIVIVP